MATERPRNDRRSAVRREGAAAPIAWTRRDVAGIHTGWVSDIAKTGVAFVTPTRDRPALGEAIDLTPGGGESIPIHRSVQVVRVAPYDQYFSIVGCRHRDTAPI